MEQEIPKSSLLWHLNKVPDARRREGRIYPLENLLGMLVLAALNGQSNLRQMWLWASKRWRIISLSWLLVLSISYFGILNVVSSDCRPFLSTVMVLKDCF